MGLRDAPGIRPSDFIRISIPPCGSPRILPAAVSPVVGYCRLLAVKKVSNARRPISTQLAQLTQLTHIRHPPVKTRSVFAKRSQADSQPPAYRVFDGARKL